jgi:hypothetical protein
VGCSSGTPDDVLWRQVAAFKDPFGTALRAAVGTEHSAFVAGLKGGSSVLPGQYWDGTSSPGDLKLAKGGLVYFDLLDSSKNVKFDVLISSGPRNPAADPLADSKPYAGPSAIYTCFVVTIEVAGQAATGFNFEDAACESKLVATLGGAELYPVDDFSG